MEVSKYKKNGRNYRDSLVNIFSIEKSSQESCGLAMRGSIVDGRNKVTIYLAGAMSNLTYAQMTMWRHELGILLQLSAEDYGMKVKAVNPVSYYNFEEKRHKSEKEIMQFDLNYIRKSDIVVVNLEGLNTSIGTCIELYEATKNNIPVLAFGTVEMYDSLHPWIKECITRVDWTKEEMVEYIEDFYFR